MLRLSGGLLGLVMVLTGCATARITYDERGQQQVSIDCTDQGSWDICYKKAAEVCPRGYFLLNRRGEGVTDPAAMAALGQRHLREMTVRCK